MTSLQIMVIEQLALRVLHVANAALMTVLKYVNITSYILLRRTRALRARRGCADDVLVVEALDRLDAALRELTGTER